MLNKNQKPCPKCGDAMHRQSKQCRACYYKKESHIVTPCPVCKIPFRSYKSLKQKYCGRSCARSGSPVRKRTQVKVTCSACEKTFYKHPSAIKKNIGKLHFCNRECWYEYNTLDNHYAYGGGQDERNNPDAIIWRKAVIARDKGYCRICHSQLRIEVHHILPFSKYKDSRWDVDNGISLCHECHVKTYRMEEYYADDLAKIAQIGLEVWV